MKHHEDCDQYQAELAADGPYGNPYIEPTDYACYCAEPGGPKYVTIMISARDVYGDYHVEIREGGSAENVIVNFGDELAEMLPESKEIEEWLR